MTRDGTRLYWAIGIAIVLGGCCKNGASGEANDAQLAAIANRAESAQAMMKVCMETPPKPDACNSVNTALGEIKTSATQGGGQ
jgi:hypothetical protein